MAGFSDAEEQLLQSVTDDRLRTNLAALRQAVESIWAFDAPRIIQNYPDHSIKHCERLADYAAKLLEANDGRPLSSQEMYLLLAGIYLHDIGMQCDVGKWPQIKAKAESMDAQFDIDFTAQSASSYSIDEQKAIRKNHQYLSIAWIDYARRTGETILGPSARNIPEELVLDLMDVCKHHTKLPIADCPLTFTFGSTSRKRLVAALLRFADELDVDGRRVSIETVKNFSLDPADSVYWWLHNKTTLDFLQENMIRLTVRLSPQDHEIYSSLIYDTFISKFRTKNRPVLDILVQNKIPLVVSDDSNVVTYDYAEPLPSEIGQALQRMQMSRSPVLNLANEVQTWLQAIRYEVSNPQTESDCSVDMLATLDQGTFKQRVLVRCIGGEIQVVDVEMLDGVLNRKTPQGWLISDTRVSTGARERATEDDILQVFTLADFLQQKVWGPYIDALKALVEKDKIPELYVGLACYKQEMVAEDREKEKKYTYSSLEGYIDKWLKERGKVHMSVLGDFGAGKTWFCRYYAYRQMQNYLNDPVHQRMPLLITLRAFAKAMTAQQLINDALLEQYKLPFVGSAFETFKELNRRGKLLLILDGFDEMARQVDYQTVVDNFWELATLVDENSKVILTSRTEYFRWAKESEKIFGGEEYGRRTILLDPPKFEVLYLEPFDDKQIQGVITRRLGTVEGPIVAKRILDNENLSQMARKPVLVELLLAALTEVSPNVLENPARVYLYATNKLLLRNITAEKTFTDTADKLYFLCELAWEMIKSDDLRIHYTSIPDRINAYFGDKIKDKHELDTWDFDLRSQTLLHRDAAGYYEFAHKSLAEYFVALKFAAELGCLAPIFMETYCEADGRSCKMPFERKDTSDLIKTFGTLPIAKWKMRAVLSLLQEMIREDSIERLWQIINETRGETLEQVKYVGGNAATLLRLKNASFAGANLANTVLVGADLSRCQLSTVDLSNCDLYQANLAGCGLSEYALKYAKIKEFMVNYVLIWKINKKTIKNEK